MVSTRMQGEEADRPYRGAMVSTRMQGEAADRPNGGRHSPRPRGSNQRSSEVIRGHPRSSEVIRGHPRSSEVIRGSSEVIRGHQRSSEVISGNQTRTAAARAALRESSSLLCRASAKARVAFCCSTSCDARCWARCTSSSTKLILSAIASAISSEGRSRASMALWSAAVALARACGEKGGRRRGEHLHACGEGEGPAWHVPGVMKGAISGNQRAINDTHLE